MRVFDVQAFPSLLEALQRLADPSIGTSRYAQLPALLTLTVCAILCGARSPSAVTRWARDLDAATIQVFGLSITQIPSARSLLRLFLRVDRTRLEKVLNTWLVTRGCAALEPRDERESRLAAVPGVYTLLNDLAKTLAREAAAGEPSASSEPVVMSVAEALRLTGIQHPADQAPTDPLYLTGPDQPREETERMEVTHLPPAVVASVPPSWQTSSRSVSAWTYLALLFVAEIFAAGVNARIAIALDALILLALIHHGARTEDESERALRWGLALVPIIRILTLSLPLARIPIIYWYGIISVPILTTAAITARTLGYSRRDLGLSLGRIDSGVVLLMVPLGLTLGAVDYLILRPQPMSSGLTIQEKLVVAPILVILAAFVDEIIFRGLLQRAALQSLGRPALVYVTVLYAAMNSGYVSAFQVVFVFLVGLLLAYISNYTRSILGVTLAHGSLSASLLLIVPLLPPFARSAVILPLALLTASIAAVVLPGSPVASLALNDVKASFLRSGLASVVGKWPAVTAAHLGAVDVAVPRTRAIQFARDGSVTLAFVFALAWSRGRSLRDSFGQVSWAELLSRVIDIYNGAIVSIPVAGRLVVEWVIHLPRYTLAIGRSARGRWQRSWSVSLSRLWTLFMVLMRHALEELAHYLRRWGAARARWLKREWSVFSSRSWTPPENQPWDKYPIVQGKSGTSSESREASSSTSLALWNWRHSALSEAELIERGIALVDAKDEREAYRYFSLAVEINPTNVGAWFWKAKTAKTLNEIVRCLEKALEIDPGNRMVAANLALFRHRLKQWRRQRHELFDDDMEQQDCYA